MIYFYFHVFNSILIFENIIVLVLEAKQDSLRPKYSRYSATAIMNHAIILRA